MKIYGVALLAACYLAGQLIGDQLGRLFHMNGNIGGVGFAMLLLILVSDFLKKKNLLTKEPEQGILFWSAMYIPVVIAMSATQNVKAALHGSWVALAVGVFVTLFMLMLVPVLARTAKTNSYDSH
jgi:malonate transporter MadL subunit